jgi:hypothetical protein
MAKKKTQQKTAIIKIKTMKLRVFSLWTKILEDKWYLVEDLLRSLAMSYYFFYGGAEFTFVLKYTINV